MVTECCSESQMRSRTSRGVPEWSGGKDLYMGSPVLVTGKVSGLPVTYRNHREGPGGPPGGATGLEGCMGQVWEGTSPRWAGMPPHKGPRHLGFGEGCFHLTWGSSFPLLLLATPWALWEAHHPTQGLVPSHSWPMQASGAGGPTWWTPGTLPVVPVRYR